MIITTRKPRYGPWSSFFRCFPGEFQALFGRDREFSRELSSRFENGGNSGELDGEGESGPACDEA